MQTCRKGFGLQCKCPRLRSSRKCGTYHVLQGILIKRCVTVSDRDIPYTLSAPFVVSEDTKASAGKGGGVHSLASLSRSLCTTIMVQPAAMAQ